MVGRLFSFFNGPVSGDILILGGGVDSKTFTTNLQNGEVHSGFLFTISDIIPSFIGSACDSSSFSGASIFRCCVLVSGRIYVCINGWVHRPLFQNPLIHQDFLGKCRQVFVAPAQLILVKSAVPKWALMETFDLFCDAFGFPKNAKICMSPNIAGWKMGAPDWRCISYWKWQYSSQLC